MSVAPACPQCTLENTYVDDARFVCADCGFEWPMDADNSPASSVQVRDCNGNTLVDGDNVVVIKDLKVKGSAVPLKQGTVIRGIRLVEDDAAHVEGNTDRIKGLVVKTCYVRKA
jgi:protein PhnA